MGTSTVKSGEQVDRQKRILDAALELLSRHGISGINMRAVAREAGVALGLVNYYYEDKSSLIRAVLHQIEEHDLLLVEPAAYVNPGRATPGVSSSRCGPRTSDHAVPIPPPSLVGPRPGG